MTEATVALASVTFVLAVAAFINIVLTWRIQARERRDRQLREVSNWAVDASRASLLVKVSRWPPEVATFELAAIQAFLRIDIISALLEESRQVGLILAAGEYIRNLAGRLDETLASAVEDTFAKLMKYQKGIAHVAVKLYKGSGDVMREYESLSGSRDKSRQRVQDSAKAVISRATELLAT